MLDGHTLVVVFECERARQLVAVQCPAECLVEDSGRGQRARQQRAVVERLGDSECVRRGGACGFEASERVDQDVREIELGTSGGCRVFVRCCGDRLAEMFYCLVEKAQPVTHFGQEAQRPRAPRVFAGDLRDLDEQRAGAFEIACAQVVLGRRDPALPGALSPLVGCDGDRTILQFRSNVRRAASMGVRGRPVE